jgi:hypothetical protein
MKRQMGDGELQDSMKHDELRDMKHFVPMKNEVC